MGDFLSKAPNSFTDYKPTGRSISHPILGEFPILQSQATGQAILQKKINIAQLEGANKSVLRSHLLLNHPNIVRFEGYEQLTNTEHNVYFENFDCTLKQEIQRRAASNTRFTEKEIVELLRCISSALAYLQGNRIVHGQIRTETIVKVGAEYKLLNMTIFGNYKSTYQQALEEMRKTQIRLLSPQLQDALYNKIVDPVHEGYKDDVYALGVVTLDVMTLSVDTGIPVTEKLSRATQVYSKTLLSVVNKMLENIMSLRLDCISCSRVIENNYVHRDYSSNSNSQAFSASKLLQRSSVRSSYRNDEPDKLTTGVSLNEIKKYSPAYRKSEKTMQEQYFSPTKHGDRDRPEYREPSSNYSLGRRSTYSIDIGKGFEHIRPQANEPILAKSYFQEQVYQSPQHPPLSSAQNLNLKSHRTSSVPKNRYQGWESNTASGYSQNPPLYKSGYQVHVSAPEKHHNSSVNQHNFAERNLSPLIKNDPFILSLLSQDPAHNNSSQISTQKPENKDYILKSSAFNSEYEKAKSSAVFSTPEHGGYKLYRAVESGDAAKIYFNGSNPESTNYQPSTYGLSTSPQINHSVQPPFAFQLYPAQPGAQPSMVSPNVYVPLAQAHHTTTNLSEPMAIDNSPIYTGYSQIQEDVHKNGRGGESFVSRSSIKYS